MTKNAVEDPKKAEFLGDIIDCCSAERYKTEYMSIACTKVGNLDLARSAFQAIKDEATSYHVTNDMAVGDTALAQLYYGFCLDDQKAIAQREANLRDYPNLQALLEGSFALMPLYFSKAQNAGPFEAEIWVLKMKHVVNLIEPMVFNSSSDHPGKYEAAALLGRWYADHNEMERARNKIRPIVKEGIPNLTDWDKATTTRLIVTSQEISSVLGIEEMLQYHGRLRSRFSQWKRDVNATLTATQPQLQPAFETVLYLE